jgi:hypothetical protein
MFDELKQADAKGATLHILLDHSEAETRAEAGKVQDLVSNLRHGDVTITTAGANSQRPAYIWHWKGMVVKPAVGQVFHCWEGRTNFTESAWFQGNSARSFRSNPWAQTFTNSRCIAPGRLPTNRNIKCSWDSSFNHAPKAEPKRVGRWSRILRSPHAVAPGSRAGDLWREEESICPVVSVPCYRKIRGPGTL